MEEIISYILSPELIPVPWITILTVARIVFMVISFLLFSFIIFVTSKSQYFTFRLLEDFDEFTKFKPREVNKLAKDWKKIVQKMESGLESEYKLAIIEADVMLDEILKRIGRTEKSLDDKLNAMNSIEIGNIKEIKEARKIRNSIVYDPDYHLTLDEAKETLQVYEETFKNLNAFS